MSARIRFLTRRGCCLCEDAEAIVRRVAARFDAAVEWVDVDVDRGLQMSYGQSVPVVQVDGETRFRFRVDERELGALLESGDSV